jgi:hypothetical protein
MKHIGQKFVSSRLIIPPIIRRKDPQQNYAGPNDYGLTKPLLLIVNPRSGVNGSLATLEVVKKELYQKKVLFEVIVTERRKHAQEIVRLFDLTSISGIVSIGGDGTAHEIINGLYEKTKQSGVSHCTRICYSHSVASYCHTF